MNAQDIKRLREQAVLQQFGGQPPDIMGGIMNQQPPNPIDSLRQTTRPTLPMGGEGPIMPTQQPTPPTDLPMGNIFQQQPQQPQGPAPGSMEELMAAINKTYTPETTSRDRFNKLLDTVPERNNPGIARRIVAGGMGIGDKTNPIQTMENTMYAPYMRDMAEWKEKAGPYQQAAQLENSANSIERQMAGNVAVAQSAANRTAVTEKYQTERNRIARIVAVANAKKAEGWKISIEGDSVWATNPNPPFDRKYLGPSGGMDEADKIAAEGEWDVKAANARAGGQLATTNAAGWTTIQYDDGTIVEYNPRTGEKRPYRPGARVTDPNAPIPKEPGNKIGTPPSGGTTNTLESNRIKQEAWGRAYSAYPEVREIMTESKSGANVIYRFNKRPELGEDKPGWGTGSVTQEELDNYDRIRKELEPEYVPPAKKEAAPASAPTPPQTGKTGGIGPTGTAPIESKSGGISPGNPIIPTGRTAEDEARSKIRQATGRETPTGQPIPQGVSKGHIAIYKNGKIVGQIENTKANIAQAIKEGYEVKGGGR